MLPHILPTLLEAEPLWIRQEMWLQHDRVSLHLDVTYPGDLFHGPQDRHILLL